MFISFSVSPLAFRSPPNIDSREAPPFNHAPDTQPSYSRSSVSHTAPPSSGSLSAMLLPFAEPSRSTPTHPLPVSSPQRSYPSRIAWPS